MKNKHTCKKLLENWDLSTLGTLLELTSTHTSLFLLLLFATPSIYSAQKGGVQLLKGVTIGLSRVMADSESGLSEKQRLLLLTKFSGGRVKQIPSSKCPLVEFVVIHDIRIPLSCLGSIPLQLFQTWQPTCWLCNFLKTCHFFLQFILHFVSNSDDRGLHVELYI